MSKPVRFDFPKLEATAKAIGREVRTGHHYRSLRHQNYGTREGYYQRTTSPARGRIANRVRVSPTDAVAIPSFANMLSKPSVGRRSRRRGPDPPKPPAENGQTAAGTPAPGVWRYGTGRRLESSDQSACLQAPDAFAGRSRPSAAPSSTASARTTRKGGAVGPRRPDVDDHVDPRDATSPCRDRRPRGQH
jgi:hypothetical protein